MKRSSSSLSRNNGVKKKRGAILFVAVGAIAVLSILAIGATSSVLQELKLARFVTDSNTSCYAASSVVEAMKVVWANDPMTQAMTLYRLRDREIPLGDKVAAVTFSDEQSRINIDVAPKDILLRLPGLSQDEPLADAVLAAALAFKEEALLLEGMEQQIYDQFKDLVTTFGAGPVNINTAPGEVLGVLGMDADLIGKIEEFLAGDDAFFSNTGEIVALLEPYNLNPVQRALLESLVASGRLTTTSAAIDLNITLKKGSKNIRFFKIVLNFNSGKIISWWEE